MTGLFIDNQFGSLSQVKSIHTDNIDGLASLLIALVGQVLDLILVTQVRYAYVCDVSWSSAAM